MKLVFKSRANGKFLSARDSLEGSIRGFNGTAIFPGEQRPIAASAYSAQSWEEFEPYVSTEDGPIPLETYIDNKIQDALHNNPPPQPPAPTWPPAPGSLFIMTPDKDTKNVEEVRIFVQEALWSSNNSDDESYYMEKIILRPEHPEGAGWTADGYWRTEKIWNGEGAGKGYAWPPK